MSQVFCSTLVLYQVGLNPSGGAWGSPKTMIAREHRVKRFERFRMTCPMGDRYA